jgi:hypothetical protein
MLLPLEEVDVDALVGSLGLILPSLQHMPIPTIDSVATDSRQSFSTDRTASSHGSANTSRL